MLLFDIENQVITRRDRFSPATDSIKYLKAKFNFKTDDWSDKSKTAVFTVFDKQYPAVIDSNNVCTVPWEALAYTVENNYRFAVDNYIYVSVVGISGDIRITTDRVKILLNLSGYGELENTNEPTPDVYTQYVNMIKAEAEAVAQALDEAEAINEEIKNSYSNAFKGLKSGAGVSVDDVSPLEHTAKVTVHGKNLIDISKFELTSTINEEHPYVTAVGESYIDITVSETYNGNGHIAFPLTLKEICPQLVVGKTYFISANSDAWNKCLYLKQLDCFWNFGNALTITEEMLDCTLGLYGYATYRGQSPGTCRISNIQIEEGTVATEYIPYEDPTSITVKRYGKNLFPVNEVTLTKTHAWGLQQMGTVKLSPGVYTAKCKFKQTGADKSKVSLSIRDYDDAVDTLISAISEKTSGELKVTFEVTPERKGIQIYLYSNNTVNVLNTECTFTELQLERGENATDFEEYIAPESYVPNEDGSVDGVKSVSPTMTLLTDNANAIVEIEYNRDVDKVMGDVESALDSIIEIQNSLIGGVG